MGEELGGPEVPVWLRLPAAPPLPLEEVLMEASLNAKYRFGAPVVLHSDGIRNADLRSAAEFWLEKRDKAIDAMDQLAAALYGPAEQWDEAVINFETDAQLPQPELELSEERALRLLSEIQKALDFYHAAKGQSPIPFPRQHERGQAA